MKKIKLLLCLLLTFVLYFTIAACDGKTDDKGNGHLDFEGLSFEDAEFTYDGTPKTISVKGCPVTAEVVYSTNAVQTNAGVYEISATVSKEGYNTKTLTATMTINKADFGIKFEDQTFVYDGTAHYATVSGELPSNLSIKYFGNGKTDAGEYEVTARISGLRDTENYISSFKATLKIEKAVYDMSGVSFFDSAEIYDGNEHALEISGLLPDGVSVSYEGGGTEIGRYTVKAKFDGDSANYHPIPDMIAELNIVDASTPTHNVKLTVNDPDGVVLVGNTDKIIPDGSNAIFKITVKSTYDLVSVSGGDYNPLSGELVIKNITGDVDVSFEVLSLGYDKNDTVRFNVVLANKDSSSINTGSVLNLGTTVTLSAGNDGRAFLGWTIGKPLEEGGVLISDNRKFGLKLVPNVIGSDVEELTVYSNYRSLNLLFYDPNGGEVDSTTVNMKGNEYYTAVFADEIVTVTISDKYMDYAESASTFWDDGSFTKDGYVLIEYNTKPDGTGESYSLGSKFYTGSTIDQTLYCIWAKATPESDFEYTDVRWGYASGVNATTAPHWKIDGVKITKYTGDDDWVVIPEKLGGKYVTTIDTDAFVDKGVKVLVFSRFIIRVDDGAFKGCDELTTVYMTDGVYIMNDEAFDEATYKNFKNFYLNATVAPRFTQNTHGDGAVFSVKLSRILASQDQNRIIVVAGSSTYQGMSSPYIEKMLDNTYRVVNLGTTRTGTGLIFFEALQHYVHEGDIVIYAPENHVNMFGKTEMWYRSYYDLEGMYNLFRYIDISHYSSVFSALSTYNKERRLSKAPTAYEDIANGKNRSDKYGDFQQNERNYFQGKVKFIDSYFLTFNKYFKNDSNWSDVDYQTANKDYLTSSTWSDITMYKDEVNRAIALLKNKGARVYFGFAPSDASSVVPEARNREWLQAYDNMILENYDFDGLLGSSADYIYARKYFYDCAYHLNNYGRTFRSFQMYQDLCKIIGITKPKEGIDHAGDINGCLYEPYTNGRPLVSVDFL